METIPKPLDRHQDISPYYRQNFFFATCAEAFWGGGMALSSVGAILPMFLRNLGSSKMLIGLLPALMSFGYTIPQLYAAYRTEPLHRKAPVFIPSHLGVILPWWLLGLLVCFFPDMSARIMLTLFFVTYVLASATLGVVVPMWLSYIHKVIEPGKRGRFFGTAFFAGAAMGVFGGMLAWKLLDALPFPQGYGLCFIFAGASYMIAILCLIPIKEPDGGGVPKKESLLHYVGHLLSILKGDRNYIRFLVSRVFCQAGLVASAFYAVYGREKLGLADSASGILTAASLIANGIASYGFGYSADRKGYKPILIYAFLLSLIAILGVFHIQSLTGLCVIFAFSGAVIAGNMIGYNNMVIEFCPSKDKTTYAALTNTLLMPFGTALPILCGYLIGRYSYEPVFYSLAILVGIGLFTLVFFVREPIHTQHIAD